MPKGIYKHPPQCGFQKGHKGFRTKESYKGIKLSEKHKEKIGLALKGKRKPPFTKKHCQNISKGKKGKCLGPNHHWKGRKIRNGYIYIYKPEHPFCDKNGYILEHRFVIEQQISRYLKTKEESHHLNNIKDDNRPQNLMLFINKSAHRRFHGNPENVKPKEIIFDGRKFN